MKKKTARKKASRPVHRASSKNIFAQHPNLKMLLYMFVLSIILWVLTYQM